MLDSRGGHTAAEWMTAPREGTRDERLVRLLDVLRYIDAAPEVSGLRVYVSTAALEKHTAQDLAERYGLAV